MAADEAKEKKSAVTDFRQLLSDKTKLKQNVLEGLKHANARVRALAIKAAFKLKDKEVLKKNVLPLITSDKSKKVLRAIADKMTRGTLKERLQKMTAPKAPKKEEAAAETPADAAKEA